MRTPLTALKASLGLLCLQKNGDGSAEAVDELLLICQRNTDHLLKLVNGLLELFRIESTPPTSTRPVALAEVVNETVESLSMLAAQQHVVITFHIPTRLQVAAEPDGVQRILVNLIGNAIKFTPGGHVDVSAEDVGEAAVLRVCDDGIGIPQERLANLFDRFTHIRRSRAQEGTGLGLAITKALVARFGGDISVQSEVNRGSVFTVTLPTFDAKYESEAMFSRSTVNYGQLAAV